MAHRRADARATRADGEVPRCASAPAHGAGGAGTPEAAGEPSEGPVVERPGRGSSPTTRDGRRVAALRLDRVLASEDDPRRWGGRGEETAPEHDRWLEEQRPPHWG